MESSMWNESAEQYAESAKNISFYKETAQVVAKILDNYDYRYFVDLGCGSSNLVLDALLKKGEGGKRVICTDASQKMVEVAQRNNSYSNAEFVPLMSEEIDFEENSICCFIANSSFWMFDFDKTLPLMFKQLKINGGLLINFSEWDLQDENKDEVRYSMIDKELMARGLPVKKYKGTPVKYNEKQISNVLKKHGFKIDDIIVRIVTVKRNDWIEFYKIPEIARKSLPHIKLEEAMGILNIAMNKLPLDYSHSMKWLFIKALKV